MSSMSLSEPWPSSHLTVKGDTGAPFSTVWREPVGADLARLPSHALHGRVELLAVVLDEPARPVGREQ